MGSRPKSAPRDADTPFCVAVLGDFSGRANRGLTGGDARQPVLIDVDNFDQVMEKMGVCLRLPASGTSGETVELKFACREDFHPDEILKRSAPLAKLLQLRKQLQNQGTASAAAAELQGMLSVPATAPASKTASGAPAESSEAAVERLLGKSPSSPVAGKPAAGKLDVAGLVKNLAGASVKPVLPAGQGGLTAALDLELTQRLRALLHHPQFQTVEAAWRSVDFLVRNLEENLKIYLVDVSKEELTADLRAQNEMQSAAIYSVLYSQPWGVLLGNYTFDESVADVDVLQRMAVISGWLGAPFIAGASPHLTGCESFELQTEPRDWKRALPEESGEAWQKLRQMPEANRIGLALPRFLLRQPYGKSSDAIETFAFEELVGAKSHGAFLWGNPAFLCAHLLMEAFKEEGWGMSAVGSGDVGDMPVYQFQQDGEKEVKPCAEAWLSERAADAMLERGLIPVLSIKGRDAVRVAKMQSVSAQAKALFFR